MNSTSFNFLRPFFKSILKQHNAENAGKSTKIFRVSKIAKCSLPLVIGGTFFHFLAQFIFTTNEAELDYYYQKVNIQVAS